MCVCVSLSLSQIMQLDDIILRAKIVPGSILPCGTEMCRRICTAAAVIYYRSLYSDVVLQKAAV